MLAALALGLLILATTVCGGDAAAPSALVPEADPRLGAPLAIRERAVQGAGDAPVVVIEFSSFKCTHCRAFHESVFPRLREEYIRTGKVQWVVINASNDPADQTDPIFRVARAALRQGMYWEINDSLFQVGLRPPGALAELLAKSPLNDRGGLEAGLRDPEIQAAVTADFADYGRLKIRGTPTFLVRSRSRNGQWVEAKIEDLQPLDFFRQVLDGLLRTP